MVYDDDDDVICTRSCCVSVLPCVEMLHVDGEILLLCMTYLSPYDSYIYES